MSNEVKLADESAPVTAAPEAATKTAVPAPAPVALVEAAKPTNPAARRRRIVLTLLSIGFILVATLLVSVIFWGMEVSQRVAAAHSRMDAANTVVNGDNGLSQRLDSAEKGVSDLQTRLTGETGFEGQVAALQEDLKKAEEANAALSTRLDAVEKEKAELAVGLTALKEKVLTAGEVNTTVDAAITKLKEEQKAQQQAAVPAPVKEEAKAEAAPKEEKPAPKVVETTSQPVAAKGPKSLDDYKAEIRARIAADRAAKAQKQQETVK